MTEVLKVETYVESIKFDENNVPCVFPNAFDTNGIKAPLLDFVGAKADSESDEIEINLFHGAYGQFDHCSIFAHRGCVDEHQDGAGYTYGVILHAEGEHHLVVNEHRYPLKTGTMFIINSDELHSTESSSEEDLIIFVTKDFFHPENDLHLSSRAKGKGLVANRPYMTPEDFMRTVRQGLETKLGLNIMKDDPFYVRPASQVLGEMKDLAFQCSFNLSEYKVEKFLARALKLMLELRVPRMPESDEELKAMIDRSLNDETPSISHDDFKRTSEKHCHDFSEWLQKYHTNVKEHEFMKALLMLLPGPESMMTWNNAEFTPRYIPGSIIVELERHCDGSEDDRMISETGTTTELSMLATILCAHAKWPDVWKR